MPFNPKESNEGAVYDHGTDYGDPYHKPTMQANITTRVRGGNLPRNLCQQLGCLSGTGSGRRASGFGHSAVHGELQGPGWQTFLTNLSGVPMGTLNDSLARTETRVGVVASNALWKLNDAFRTAGTSWDAFLYDEIAWAFPLLEREICSEDCAQVLTH